VATGAALVVINWEAADGPSRGALAGGHPATPDRFFATALAILGVVGRNERGTRGGRRRTAPLGKTGSMPRRLTTAASSEREPAVRAGLRDASMKKSQQAEQEEHGRGAAAESRQSGQQETSVHKGQALCWSSWKQLLPGGIMMAVVGAVFAWAYWPTLLGLVHTWNSQPDYSHGFFVVPLALYFLWARRDGFPGVSIGFAWPGLVLVGLSICVRIAGALIYIGPIDGWSIPLWVAGVVWLLGGWRLFCWSLPSVAFLCFMVPLPFRVERWLSLPLQGVATKMSCWTLESLGQPVVARGNTILIGQFHLEVEQACSGLRIFVGIVALAFAYLILVRRTWWEKALLLLSVLPIALIANSARIVVTGLLYQYASGEAAHRFAHDMAGWVMIPFAAALFALVLWYLRRLMPEVEPVDTGSVVRGQSV